jgi:hypothetical protein
VKPAPRRRRSLLRRLRGTCGAALIATPARNTLPSRMQRPALRPIETSSALRPCLARQVRVSAVAVFVFSIVAAGLWVAPARADETPAPPPVTTTVADAPPPDPYQAPARATKSKPAPRRVAPVVRSLPAAPTRSYAPSAPAVTPRQATQRSAKPKRKPKVVRKQRPRREAPVVTVSLAPLADVIAAADVPPAADRDSQEPYLWLAGVAFAVLAVAGTGLVMLTQRFYRPRWD